MPAPPSRSERAGRVKVLANHRLHQRTVIVDIRLVNRFGARERIVVSGAHSLLPKDRACWHESAGPRTAKLRGLAKIAELGVQRALECRSCRATLEVGAETLVARHDVGVAQD